MSSSLSIQEIRGVGPKRARALATIGIRTIEDLLRYIPRSYLDRSNIVPIGDLHRYIEEGRQVTVVGSVFKKELQQTRNRKKIFFLTVKDHTGFLTCVFYQGIEWYQDAFTRNDILALSAVPEIDRYRRIQFIHPEFDRLSDSTDTNDVDYRQLLHTGSIIPQYSLTEELREVGLDNRGMRRTIRTAVQEQGRVIQDFFPSYLLEKHQFQSIQWTLEKIHFPRSDQEREKALQRLKYEELFFYELLIAMKKRESKQIVRGRRYCDRNPLLDRMIRQLPFSLTRAQQRVLGEIRADLHTPSPMNRLLQGDVGSGKTIVAMGTMCMAIDSGFQCALMVPTEILAVQHYRSIARHLEPLGVRIRLLIGGQKKNVREEILNDIQSGQAQITIGTHALIEEQVTFSNLGLIVIDEQHRFGVYQRSQLSRKGMTNPDVLIMTATPIPRTLALTMYGDLDVSMIDEMPVGRKAVRTVLRETKDRSKIFTFARNELQKGRQMFFIYPLIEKSEKTELKAAVAEHRKLRDHDFKDFRVGLIHGSMSTEEKDNVMLDFADGRIDVLVATTVVEVGVDIPNATIMVIENPERFGLAQLHQLRGRIGRGSDQAYCILLHDPKMDQQLLLLSQDRFAAKQHISSLQRRLSTMVETSDGFRIAEEDLKIRGGGEFFGLRQSGLPGFSIADLSTDYELLQKARNDAFQVVHQDAQLSRPEHMGIKTRYHQHYRHLFSLGWVG